MKKVKTITLKTEDSSFVYVDIQSAIDHIHTDIKDSDGAVSLSLERPEDTIELTFTIEIGYKYTEQELKKLPER